MLEPAAREAIALVQATSFPPATVPPSYTRLPQPRFANDTERAFAAYLDRRAVAWQYEPRTFVLREEAGQLREAFTPDFYLPDLDRYVEVTTLRQSLVTDKNRKLRLVRERYQGIDVRILYRRDCVRLGLSPPPQPVAHARGSDLTGLARRLAPRIAADHTGDTPLVVGVPGGGAIPALAVAGALGCLAETRFLRPGEALPFSVFGRRVVVVDDVADTRLTLAAVTSTLWDGGAASVRSCVLETREGSPLSDLEIDYVGTV